MSNEAARELISVAVDLLKTSSDMIKPKEKSTIYGYPLERCPNAILEKWVKDTNNKSVLMLATVEIKEELETRKKFNIKIEVVK